MAKKKKRSKKGPLTPGIKPPATGDEKNTKSPKIGDSGENKDADRYQIWLTKISQSRKLRSDWERDYKVEECGKFLVGKQLPVTSSAPVFNHTLATAKVIKPNIFYTHPKFFVRPKPGRPGKDPERASAIGEGLLEAIGEQDNNLKNAANLALWQNFCRIGVLKVIYDPKMVPNPQAGEPMVQTDDEGVPILDERGEKIPIIDPSTQEPLLEPAQVMTDEAFRYQWVDSVNMLLPDAGPDQTRWPWIGEEVVVPLDEAKEDTRFKQSLRSKLVANETLSGKKKNAKRSRTQNRSMAAFDDKADEALRYIEIYDIHKKTMLALAEGQDFDDFLIDGDLPDGIEDHPYAIILGFTPILEPEPSPWPLPDIQSWLDIQKEYNIRRKQITEGAKRSARKGVYDDGTFPDSDEAVKLLQSPDDMVFAKVNDINKKPEMLDSPDLNQAIYKDIGLLFQDWRIITGQTGARMADPDSDTATEATFVERAGNLRDADKLDAVNDWLTMAGKKMLQLVKRNITMGMWIKMRGFDDSEFKRYVEKVYGIPMEVVEFLPGLKELFKIRFGEEKPFYITREKLTFEAQVSVVPGSFRPRNLDAERQQWLEFLKVVGSFPQLALSRELLRETASKFEYISERMLDELTALAQKMIQVNANQAGRAQGGANGDGNPVQQAMAGMVNANT